MRILIQLTILSFIVTACSAQQKNQKTAITDPSGSTKLVVGITIDQLRYELLLRFWDDFESDGFKKLVNEGFIFRNHHYDYAPTFTGPGHASIYTGTSPAHHGIIANDWFDRKSGTMHYCASDTSVKSIGAVSSGGQMSPHRMVSSTFTDQLRLASNKRSKVFGISMKDRGAILPAGHTPNAAYWFLGKNEGKWISSSWYMNELPSWVIQFNAKNLPEQYLSQTWSPLKSDDVYDESLTDNNAYESPFKGTAKAAFPYNLADLRALNGDYELIKSTPWGNTLTVDFAKALIENESLGTDEFVDVLAMSFSSTDYAGHQFGPMAKETQDVYLRLDRDLADFVNYLDTQIGKNNYLLFITADHGGSDVPSHFKSLDIPAGYYKSSVMEDAVEDRLSALYGIGDYVQNVSNEQVFFNRTTLTNKKLNLEDISTNAIEALLELPGIWTAVPASAMRNNDFSNDYLSLVQDGFYPTRSGDIVCIFEPSWIEYGFTGSTHGSVYSYDTHVPLIFYGNGINKGETHRKTQIRDIAPTLSAILKIAQPNACTGLPLPEVIK
jgi:predicted AlkP superfamily pyrophosphatase or phosphodiesterase